MADNFDEFDDDRDEVEAAEEDALYLAEEVNTDDEGDDDAELASASSTLDEEEDVEDADEDGNEPGFISEEERARSLMVDMPNPHGSIIEGANGGEGTIVLHSSARRCRPPSSSIPCPLSSPAPCPMCAMA